jgi:acylphosphatase
MEKFYTPEQLQKLKERLEKADPKKIKVVEEAWPKLFERFEQALQQGVSPSDPSVQKLALEAQHYIDQFTGGDKAIEASMDLGYEAHQESALKTWGISKNVFDYAQQARKLLKEKK